MNKNNSLENNLSAIAFNCFQLLLTELNSSLTNSESHQTTSTEHEVLSLPVCWPQQADLRPDPCCASVSECYEYPPVLGVR